MSEQLNWSPGRRTPFAPWGYFAVGVFNMKTHTNYGTLFRTAMIMGASLLFTIGRRFQRQHSDTMKSWRHLPTLEYRDLDDFLEHRPYDCPIVGVELAPGAQLLHQFQHPHSAVYLLGAEDHGLTPEALRACQHVVRLPGERSMNVAAAGSIVLYDRVTRYPVTIHNGGAA